MIGCPQNIGDLSRSLSDSEIRRPSPIVPELPAPVPWLIAAVLVIGSASQHPRSSHPSLTVLWYGSLAPSELTRVLKHAAPAVTPLARIDTSEAASEPGEPSESSRILLAQLRVRSRTPRYLLHVTITGRSNPPRAESVTEVTAAYTGTRYYGSGRVPAQTCAQQDRPITHRSVPSRSRGL
eukprot:561165-Hanusia_phi.AAC.5